MTTPALTPARLGLALLALSLSAPLAQSAVVTYKGTAGGSPSFDWGTAGNWDVGTVPTSADIATFSLGTTGNPKAVNTTPTLAGSFSVLGLDFSAATTSYTLSATSGSLTIGSSGISDTSGAAQTISAPLILGTAQSWTASPSTASLAFTVSGTVNNGGNLLTLTGTGTAAAISGAISGAGGVTKSGLGTWTLSGLNTYTGTTTVSAGSLNVTQALPSANAVIVDGGTLTFTANQTVSSLSGAGGTIAFTAGTKVLTVAQAGDTSYAGAITGTAVSLAKSGAGTLTLSGANTYTGGTSITGGTVNLIGSLSSATNTVTIGSGATLAGTGTIAGATSLSDGGFISPATASIGTLSLASLTWNSNTGASALNITLGTNNATDKVAITGAFLKGAGTTFTVDFGGTGVSGDVYKIATFGSTTFSGTDFAFINLAPGITGSFSLNANDLSFVTTAIPEPSTYAALVGIGALGLAAYRRRQARSAATMAVTTSV